RPHPEVDIDGHALTNIYRPRRDIELEERSTAGLQLNSFWQRNRSHRQGLWLLVLPGVGVGFISLDHFEPQGLRFRREPGNAENACGLRGDADEDVGRRDYLAVDELHPLLPAEILELQPGHARNLNVTHETVQARHPDHGRLADLDP